MAVVLGKLVVTGNVEDKGPNSRLVNQSEKPAITKEADTSNQGHVLVVNGKEKKISKKSAYLLDMLTLDDE